MISDSLNAPDFTSVWRKSYFENLQALNFAREESRRSAHGSSAELADRVAELLPRGAKILELGGGDGELSLALARKELFQVSLADFSEQSLAQAKRLFAERRLKAEFIVENAGQREPEFDLVINAGVMEHFEQPEQAAFLRDLAGRSRKFVLVLVPNRQCYWYWMWRNQKAAEGQWAYGNEVPRVDLSAAFEAAGLRFLGQTYLGIQDTENYINDLDGVDRKIRDLAIDIHRSHLIPQSQSACLLAALGTVEAEPQAVPVCWKPPEFDEAGRVSALTSALSDALASRIGNEAKLQHLERQFEECHAKLGKTEHEFSKMEIQAKLLDEKLKDMEASSTWRIALKMQAVRKLLLPPGSRRTKALKNVFHRTAGRLSHAAPSAPANDARPLHGGGEVLHAVACRQIHAAASPVDLEPFAGECAGILENDHASGREHPLAVDGSARSISGRRSAKQSAAARSSSSFRARRSPNRKASGPRGWRGSWPAAACR